MAGDDVRFTVAASTTVLLLLCLLPTLVPAVLSQKVATFSTDELDALQSLWAAWNKSTPNTKVNLAGWMSSGGKPFYPCNTNIDIKWRGVMCLQHQVNETTLAGCIIGITLNDASIGGILPRDVGKLQNLVMLTLTGNENLTGDIPVELGGLPLNILDLHDNAFTGPIPTEFSQLRFVLQLDLSGNRLVGDFPTQFMLTSKTPMQVFKISSNLLVGDIPEIAFQNMTQLLLVDLACNRFTGLPPRFTYMPNLNYLNLSYNLFTRLAPLPSYPSRYLPQSLAVLDLSGLSIGGGVPNLESLELPNLEHLYLDDNKFTGVLNVSTVFGGNIASVLKVLSLKDNNIIDVVYTDVTLGIQSKIFLQGNPYCQGLTSRDDGRRCYCEQICFVTPDSAASRNEARKVAVIISICSAVILTLVILAFSLVLHRNRKRLRALYDELEDSEVNAKKFSYRELRAATRNFSPAMKLGSGAFGAVYKGILPNKTEVAVKQLFLKTKEGRDSFINEVLLISNLQHRNLVTLKGYSLHGKEMLLVYEYVENSDLDKLLLSPRRTSNHHELPNWQARMNICLGVAQGLYYLHASSQSRILHRDIKASNILLDKNLNPKIADFGLARPFKAEESMIFTERCAGTLGYLAPEYVFFGQLSEKADVFSFGVLLLEILSGRRNRLAIDANDDDYLPIYAWKLQSEGKVMDLVDKRLELDADNMSEVQRVVSTATLCVHTSPEKRPSMFSVLAMLAGDTLSAAPQLGQSNIWSDFPSPPFTDQHSKSSTSPSTSKSPSFTNGNAIADLSQVLCR